MPSLTLPDPPEFADKIANIGKLNAEQRDELHGLAVLIGDLPPSEVRRSIFLQSTIHRLENKIGAIEQNLTKLNETISTMDAHVKASFALGDYHKSLMRITARKLLVDPKRTNFDIAAEALKHLEDNAVLYRIEYIYKNPVFREIFVTEVRTKCSESRTALKKIGEESVVKTPISLTAFTESVAEKFMEGALGEAVGPAYTLRWSLFRRYIRETREILDPVKRKALGLPAKKDTDTKGENFFQGYAQWILIKQKNWGKNMQADGWIACLEETIAWERMRFPSDKLSAIPTTVIAPPATSTVPTITQFNPQLPFAQMPVMPPPVTPVVPRHSTAFQDRVNTPQTPRNPPTMGQAHIQTPSPMSSLPSHVSRSAGIWGSMLNSAAGVSNPNK
ncbi:hypothetical protein M422DRAFT_256590 [Sphaerobolus stellatus SS14]|uniref:Uncharacterized protein n=1 Tax=Sphaerobolus stellatus (strain SS14) TaxID=990650 RepID=A0A0C9UBW6_SPHS4|nr:hypothetical protein M422DRAFT_256590 [Sphaerobolus stellatus SS14]